MRYSEASPAPPLTHTEDGIIATDTPRPTNRLAQETSPYLLQHADNPVDWFPWCDEAFELARKTGRPLLLSVGYSACHWCHVMAHESFEDPDTARLMNQLFVNVKVDREERPDIDKIYQTAHQLLTQRPGGWPLTMFLDADTQRPFFGGTYFPKESRYGMPAFGELIRRVAEYYRDHRDEVRDQGAQLAGIMQRLSPELSTAGTQLASDLLDGAREQMARAFDREYGGFGGAPKFPQPPGIERLLRHWRASASGDEPDLDALYMVTLTLTRMAEGGIYDHVGGGFCRYSVDRYWQIPHFEKMLYDNGPLLALYAEAAVATGEALFRRVATETGEWLLRDMRAENGGFYSSRDADSEGEEGRYYVWTREELEELLDGSEYEAVAGHFGLDAEPNFEGRWHLAVRRPLADVAGSLGCDENELREVLDAGRRKLRAARDGRVAPGRDEKQLASWNALAIRGLAIAGRMLGRPDFVQAAAAAADFVAANLRRDGRLLAVFKDGRARFPAYLDDHAYLLDALLQLLQAEWHGHHLELAIELADLLLEHFMDEANGGFYFTADDHEQLMHRPKPLADESVPSGNGVAALALQRLGFLLGESRYLGAAEKTLRYAGHAMQQYAHAHVTLLTALEEYLKHPEIVLIRGNEAEVRRWRDALAGIYAPRRLVFAIPGDGTLPGSLGERRADGVPARAWHCVGSRCGMPVDTLDELVAELRETTGAQ